MILLPFDRNATEPQKSGLLVNQHGWSTLRKIGLVLFENGGLMILVLQIRPQLFVKSWRLCLLLLDK